MIRAEAKEVTDRHPLVGAPLSSGGKTTVWDKFRQSVANVSEQDRRRALLVSVPALIAIGGVAAMSQWAVWATVLFAVIIVVLGAFLVATGLTLRER